MKDEDQKLLRSQKDKLNMMILPSRLDNKGQKYFKCSCELYIEDFKVSHAGYLYFIWSDSYKQTQTLKYDSISSTSVQLNQNLSLNLTLCNKNGKFLQKPTNLFLLNELGQQLDDIQLNVNQWPGTYKEMNIPIGGGSMHVKVRRRQLMEVQNMEQDEQENYQQLTITRSNNGRAKMSEQQDNLFVKSQQRSFYMKNQKSFVSGQMNSQSLTHNQQLLQQLAITKKQLQDNVYLNNKLKNDRDVLMKKQQSLQIEIESIIITTSQQVKKLREHYERRLEMRQGVYEEEIEEMIALVNGNSEYSKKVIQQVLSQKVKLQDENRGMTGEIRKVRQELQEYKDKYEGEMQTLNAQMAKKIDQFQRQKQQKAKKLQEQSLKQKLQLQSIKMKILKQKSQIQSQLQAYKQQFQKSRINNQSLQEQLLQQVKKHQQKQVQVSQKIQQIQKATSNIRTLTQMLQQQEKLIAQLKGEVEALKLQNQQSAQQLVKLNSEVLEKDDAIAELQAKLEEITYQLQFNQDAHKQLKVQHEEKEHQLYSQLENIQAIYNDKMEQYARKLHQKMQELNKENNQLRQKLGLSEKQLSQIQSQLQQKHSEIQSIWQSQKGQGGKQKQQKVKRLQTQKQTIKRQFQEKLKQMQLQLQNKDEQLSQRIMQLQDQLHITSKNKDQSQIIIKQYQRQLQHIRSPTTNHPSPRHMKQSPLLLNRSVQLSPLQSPQVSQQQITLGASNPNEMERQLLKKDQEIQRLNYRIQQMNKWCKDLQNRLKQAEEMRVVEYCESEKNEEQHINKDENKKKMILDDLQVLQKHKHNHKHGPASPKARNSRDITLDQANFGYTPKNMNYLKRKQSMGMSKQLSEHSNNSYIRVSHNQKINEQQQLLKEFEDRQLDYKKQVEEYTRKIQLLTGEIDKIKKQLQEYIMKPPVSQSIINQLEAVKVLTVSQKEELDQRARVVSQLREELLQIKPELEHLRSVKPQLEQQLRQSNKSLNQSRQIIMQFQIKTKDTQRKLQQAQQSQKKSNNDQQNLGKTIALLQQKIRQFKQHEQQLRMQNRQLMFVNEQTTNQMKKYKTSTQQLQDKLKKYAGSDVTIKQLQKEVQEWNKKNLQQVRTYNHLKLQKDSQQEQMKLVKKRHAQQTRLAIEWQEKAGALQRTIDQYKRKQAKFKRQIQQAQQQTRKTRNQSKKIQEQLHTLQTLSTSFNYQKKKFMDELAQKGDQLTRKQYQNNRLLKQLQKYRHKIQDAQDNRMGRKHQLRYEIQKLQGQAIKKDKRILQMQQQLKLLKGRLQFLQKQNTKIMQKKTQTYGDKLKHYIDEIASIKKLLDEYQSQNTKLKIQNNQFYEECELLKLSLSKLEKKYEQNIDNQETILNDLQHYMEELNVVSEKNRQYQVQLDRLEHTYMQVKKQLDQEKMHNKKKTQKLQTQQKTNSLLMDEVKQLKIKLSQLQTQTKIAFNINQKYRALDRKKNQLQQQYKKVKTQLDSHKSIYLYKQQDTQKLISDLRNSQRKQKDLQISAIVQQMNKSHTAKANKFQNQLLEMFTQNSKLREDLHIKSEQLSKVRLQIVELQSMTQKLFNLQNLTKELYDQIAHLKQQVKRKHDKISKDQVYIKELQTKIDSKQVELVDHINRVNELEMKIQKLNTKIHVYQENEDALQDRIRELIHKQKQTAQNKLDQHNTSGSVNGNGNSPNPHYSPQQQLQRRIFDLQLQLAKTKQKQNSLTTQYNSKIKSLQHKLQQMSQTMLQHQKQLQKHYQQQLYKSEQSVIKLSEQLQDKLLRIDELNQAIIVLQHQNQEMAKELENNTYKIDQETEIFNLEYNKLKQKLKDSEDVYNKNLKSLEEELTAMGKQLTMAKFNRNSQSLSQSKLNGSEIQDSKKALKRAEQKVKTKDKKIQQLKSNIYILQQTILKLRKKQSSTDIIHNQYQTLRIDYSKLQTQLKQKTKKHFQDLKPLQDQIRQLKQQLLSAKQTQQKAKISLEEKIMEVSSMEAQLKTTKQLYNELQRQIDKRKINLTNQMQEESLVVIQLRNKQSIITDQRQRIQELTMSMSSLTSEHKKLTQQLKLITTQLKEQTLKAQSLARQHQDHQNSKTLTKQQLQQLRDKNLMLQSQIKSLRTELHKMKRFYQDSKTQLSRAYQQMQKTGKGSQFMNSKIRQYQQIVIKFRKLQEISIKQLGVTLQQLIEEGYFMQTLQEKENQINQLIEEVEELKFLTDRKLLDYDQLKKQNYQLVIKAEDNEILTEQVDNLRKICDKLQEEKKQATFREELIKMHLGNLVENTQHDDDYKRKIQHILRNVAINHFGAVSFGQSSFGNY